MSGLPRILAAVEAVAGLKVALKLAQEFGGLEISLSAKKGSALVRAVGHDAALAIVRELGHGKVLIPMATMRGQKGRQAAAAELMAKGVSAQRAALTCDVHSRTAWRIRAKAKKAGTLL